MVRLFRLQTTYRLQVGQISRVESPGHLAGYQTLHQERNTENIHPRIPQDLDLRGLRPGIVLSKRSGDVGLAKLCTGFTDAEPCSRSVTSPCGQCKPRTGKSRSTLLSDAAFGRDHFSATGIGAGQAGSTGRQ